VSKAVKLYQLNRKLHKRVGVILSISLMFIAVTGLLLIFYKPLGLGTALKKGTGADLSQSIHIDKVVSIATSQELPGVTSIEDILRIELSPSENTYRVRLTNNQEVQIDANTGKVLSTNPDYTGLLISLHDGSFFGNWYRYSVLTMAGISLILLSLSGYYMVGYPLYKHLVARNQEK
jgi:uncharacterized iron-regulated membrane protein